jgi:putative DNA primase/helicase
LSDIRWWLDRLDGVEERTSGWVARCPAHDDNGPSLSLSEGDGGKVLAHCFAGCSFEDIMAALRDGDGGDSLGAETSVSPDVPAVTITYSRSKGDGLDWWATKLAVERPVLDRLPIETEGSGVAFTFPSGVRKVRQPPKQFGWEGEPAPPLWPYPEESMPARIWITEGEGDACTAWQLGHSGYAATKGSSSPPSVAMFESLRERGVEHVTVVGDADEPGRKFRDQCARNASSADLAVSVANLDNIFDPFAGLNDLNDLWRMSLAEADGDVARAREECGALLETVTVDFVDRLQLISVDDLLALENDEHEWLIPNLIHHGDKAVIFGPQKSFKTWVTLDLVRALTEGKPFLQREDWRPEEPANVLLIEEEGAARSLAKRVSTLQLSEEARARLHIMHRQGFTFNDRGAVELLDRRVKTTGTRFLIFDPLQRMAAGIDENDATETALVWDTVNELLRRNPGLTVLVIHHASKDEGRSGWNALRGSSRLAGEVDLGMMLRRGLEKNRLKLWLDGRDIPQYLDEPGDHIAVEYEVRMADAPEDRRLLMNASPITVSVNNAQDQTAESNRVKIVEYVSAHPLCTKGDIVEGTGLSKPAVNRHLQLLVEDEVFLTEQGERRGQKTVLFSVNTEGGITE